jgi:ubiquitin C-terminal hydrolase
MYIRFGPRVSKIDTAVAVDEELVVNSASGTVTYALFGAVIHRGQPGYGHYTAICTNSDQAVRASHANACAKDDSERQPAAWYHFDDEKVRIIR